MKITYDPSANAVYIMLQKENQDTKGIIHQTKGDYPIHLDYMKDGKLFGIEILEASTMIDLENLKKLNYKEFKK